MPGTTTSRQSGIAAAMVLRSAGGIQPSFSPHKTRCGCLISGMRRSSSLLSRSRLRLKGVPIQMPSETPKVCSRIRSKKACRSPSPSRNRGTMFGARLSGTNSETAAVAIIARVTSRLAIIDAEQPDLFGIERHAERRHRIEREDPAEALRLHQHHARRNDAAGGMGGEVTERNFQRVERRQHVLRMLLHRVVGIVLGRRRAVAFAAAAPVDPDHPEIAGKQRCGELDPVLAGEIAVDEDDGDVALSPLSPAELHLARTHPRHSRPLLVQAGGRRRARRRRRDSERVLIGRAVDQPVDRDRRVDDDAARRDEVDDIVGELDRVVGVDEVTGVRIDLHRRTVSGERHAVHEGNDDVAGEILQPVERGAGNERLLGAEGQEDRRLDLR